VTEKRKFPRTTVDLEGTLLVDGAHEETRVKVRNLGIGGLFLTANISLSFGAKVTVTIDFPAPVGRLVFPAVVRWRDNDGTGLEFGLLGAKQTHAIAQLMRRRLPTGSAAR
jgi:type IV pilus assembly protein PilZ